MAHCSNLNGRLSVDSGLHAVTDFLKVVFRIQLAFTVRLEHTTVDSCSHLLLEESTVTLSWQTGLRIQKAFISFF